jgi:hypothetical protein
MASSLLSSKKRILSGLSLLAFGLQTLPGHLAAQEQPNPGAATPGGAIEVPASTVGADVPSQCPPVPGVSSGSSIFDSFGNGGPPGATAPSEGPSSGEGPLAEISNPSSTRSASPRPSLGGRDLLRPRLRGSDLLSPGAAAASILFPPPWASPLPEASPRAATLPSDAPWRSVREFARLDFRSIPNANRERGGGILGDLARIGGDGVRFGSNGARRGGSSPLNAPEENLITGEELASFIGRELMQLQLRQQFDPNFNAAEAQRALQQIVNRGVGGIALGRIIDHEALRFGFPSIPSDTRVSYATRVILIQSALQAGQIPSRIEEVRDEQGNPVLQNGSPVTRRVPTVSLARYSTPELFNFFQAARRATLIQSAIDHCRVPTVVRVQTDAQGAVVVQRTASVSLERISNGRLFRWYQADQQSSLLGGGLFGNAAGAAEPVRLSVQWDRGETYDDPVTLDLLQELRAEDRELRRRLGAVATNGRTRSGTASDWLPLQNLTLIEVPQSFEGLNVEVEKQVRLLQQLMVRAQTWRGLIATRLNQEVSALRREAPEMVRSTYESIKDQQFKKRFLEIEVQELDVAGALGSAFKEAVDAALVRRLQEQGLSSCPTAEACLETRRTLPQSAFNEVRAQGMFAEAIRNGALQASLRTRMIRHELGSGPVRPANPAAPTLDELELARILQLSAEELQSLSRVPIAKIRIDGAASGALRIVFWGRYEIRDGDYLPITDERVQRVLQQSVESRIEGFLSRRLAYLLFSENRVSLYGQTCPALDWPCISVTGGNMVPGSLGRLNAQVAAEAIFSETLIPGQNLIASDSGGRALSSTLHRRDLLNRVLTIDSQGLNAALQTPNRAALERFNIESR